MTILVLDVGSSSVRALLFDEHLTLIPDAIARRKHHFMTELSGQSTANAGDLRGLIEQCIDDILVHPQANTITAVGMATFVGNVLGVDANYAPITPLYTYADTRSQMIVPELMERLDLAQVHQRTGCRIHSAYNTAKLYWLKEHESETCKQVTQWTDFATYCYRTWFGRDVPTSYSVASWSGLLDRENLTWDDTWLDVLGSPQLPELADYTSTQQGLSSVYRERWATLADVPFCLAVGDGVGANIGVGGVSPDVPVLTIGTTAAVRMVTPQLDSVPDGLWAYRVDSGRYLLGGATSEGGNVFGWAMNTLKLDADTLDDDLLARQPAQHGLTALPHLAGERSPGWQGDATGMLHGLHLGTQPIDMLQALLEGVAFRLRLIVDQLGTENVAINASGGALEQSRAWRQIIADVMGRPLRILSVQEATARGVAILVKAHLDPHYQAEPPTIAETIMSNEQHTQIYEKHLNAHVEMYDLLYSGKRK